MSGITFVRSYPTSPSVNTENSLQAAPATRKLGTKARRMGIVAFSKAVHRFSNTAKDASSHKARKRRPKFHANILPYNSQKVKHGFCPQAYEIDGIRREYFFAFISKSSLLHSYFVELYKCNLYLPVFVRINPIRAIFLSIFTQF